MIFSDSGRARQPQSRAGQTGRRHVFSSLPFSRPTRTRPTRRGSCDTSNDDDVLAAPEDRSEVSRGLRTARRSVAASGRRQHLAPARSRRSERPRKSWRPSGDCRATATPGNLPCPETDPSALVRGVTDRDRND